MKEKKFLKIVSGIMYDKHDQCICEIKKIIG